MSRPRVVFFGTAEISARTLRGLLEAGHDIVAVVSQPDRPRGRRLALEPTPTRRVAEEAGLPLFQPESCAEERFLDALRGLDCDLLAVAAYGQFIPLALRRLPRLAPLNLHFSLLPAYRGAAPVNWALVEGARRTGVCVQRMVRRMDAGDVLLEAAVDIGPTETAPELAARLTELGVGVLGEALERCEELLPRAVPQDESRVSHAPRLCREHGGLDFQRPVDELFNRWRGLLDSPLLPAPGVFCGFDGERLKVLRCRPAPEATTQAAPGTVVEVGAEGWLTACGDGGFLWIEEVQAPGGARLGAREFANGRRLGAPFSLESVEPAPKEPPG